MPKMTQQEIGLLRKVFKKIGQQMSVADFTYSNMVRGLSPNHRNGERHKA